MPRRWCQALFADAHALCRFGFGAGSSRAELEGGGGLDMLGVDSWSGRKPEPQHQHYISRSLKIITLYGCYSFLWRYGQLIELMEPL